MTLNNGNILITSIGRRVELLNFFITELKKFNKSLKVFTADMSPELSAASSISKYSIKLPPVNSHNFVSKLIFISKKYKINYIIPTIDTELSIFSKNKSKFLEQELHIICSDYEIVKTLRDKRNLLVIAKRFNVNTPKIYPLNNIIYPCFAKPYDGSSSKDIMIIKDKNDLRIARKNKKMFYSKFLNSSFKEYTIDAYYNMDSHLVCSVPRERISVRGGEIEKGITRKGNILSYFETKFIKFPGLIGPITFQIMANTKRNKFYLIEINPRFGGGYPLSYHAGANYPKYLIKEHIFGKKLSKFRDWKNNLMSLRYDKDVIIKR